MKSILYMPKPDGGSQIVAQGYKNALECLGHRVFICNCPTKFHTQNLIEEQDISLIFTSCKYGIRQLPIDIINKRKIGVIVEALPWNSKELFVDGPYEVSDPCDIDTINKIDTKFVHTKIIQELWSEHMDFWIDNNINLEYLPYAGDLMGATSRDFRTQFRACFVGNLSHKRDRFTLFILPILERLRFLNLSCLIYGDTTWKSAGIPNYGILYDHKKLSDLYSQSMVCFNFHTEDQISAQAYLNERSFTIQLYGGKQITDMVLSERCFEKCIAVGNNTTKFIEHLEGIINRPLRRFLEIRDAINNASDNHTYFNRLCAIFEGLDMRDDLEECRRIGLKLSNAYKWEMDAILSALSRGEKQYETTIKRISRSN